MTNHLYRPNRRGISRRTLLQSLGLGAAAAPLMPLMNASGQDIEITIPKRLLLIFTPDGAPALAWNQAVDWRPTGTETDFNLHFIHEPLSVIKNKILIPWGLTHTAAGAGEAHAHGMAGLWSGATLHGPESGATFDGGNGALTGWGSGATVDQLIAQAWGAALPYSTAPNDPVQDCDFRSLELAVQPGNPTSLTRMIYAGDRTPIHPDSNPKNAFRRIFGDFTAPGEQDVEDPAGKKNAERRAVIDLLRGDLSRIRTKVGSEDYQKLDAHLEGLLAMEQRLNADDGERLPTQSCSVPDEPEESTGRGGDFPTEIRQMMDITGHMLACDRTRIASLQLSCGFSNVTHSWLGHTSAHHTMSHDNSDRRQQLQEIDNWYSQQFLYLLELLDSFPEGDGTLLDNTLVVWGRELGNTAHQFEKTPVVVAGGKNLGVSQNRYLSLDGKPSAALLVSIAQTMGLDINSIGDIRPDSGPLSGFRA